MTESLPSIRAASPSSEKADFCSAFVFGADFDDTLLPIEDRPPEVRRQGREALERLNEALRRNATNLLGLGTVSGRSIADLDTALELPEFRTFADMATFKIASVGTVVHSRQSPESEFERDSSWPPQVEGWEPLKIRRAMEQRPELKPQPLPTQNDHKISYFVEGVPDAEYGAYVAELEEVIAGRGVGAQVIFSSGQFLDFLPTGIHKGSAYDHVIGTYTTNIRPPAVAAGNSMNDKEFLEVADFAIVPGNADGSLQEWAKSAIPYKSYVAREEYAAGVLEGLQVAGRIELISFLQ